MLVSSRLALNAVGLVVAGRFVGRCRAFVQAKSTYVRTYVGNPLYHMRSTTTVQLQCYSIVQYSSAVLFCILYFLATDNPKMENSDDVVELYYKVRLRVKNRWFYTVSRLYYDSFTITIIIVNRSIDGVHGVVIDNNRLPPGTAQ